MFVATWLCSWTYQEHLEWAGSLATLDFGCVRTGNIPLLVVLPSAAASSSLVSRNSPYSFFLISDLSFLFFLIFPIHCVGRSNGVLNRQTLVICTKSGSQTF